MGKRKKMIAEIERSLAQLDDRPGLCLHVAHRVAQVLWRHKLPVVLQAGSLQWPRIRLPEEDDGEINTHFSYMFSPHTLASRLSMAAGNLPELHCWVGLVDTQEIVDFSTRHLAGAALKLEMFWTAPAPPRFLWCGANQLPDQVRYEPNREATLYACSVLKKLFDPPYLR